MHKEIKNVLDNNGLYGPYIDNKDSLKRIYNIFFNNTKYNIDDLNSSERLYYGLYCIINKNIEDMLICLNKLVEEKESLAMSNLAEYYYKNGDHENMIKYHLMAIENGSVLSMNNLAYYYQYDNKNSKKMLKYYLKAIDLGDKCAMYNLGVYYANNKNTENAKKYYLMAIEKGDIPSMGSLGDIFKNENNFDDSIKYYLMAIEKGNVVSMYKIACVYKKIGDYSNMIKYHLMAIEHNDSDSMTCLGIYYENIGDIENMLKYYLMGVESGNTIAMFNLADYYRRINDTNNMIFYYLKGSDNGDPDAMYSLGFYYKKTGDLNNMLKYYLMASELGENLSTIQLALHYHSIKEFDKFVKYFKLILKKDDSHASNALISFFENSNNDKDLLWNILEVLYLMPENNNDNVKKCLNYFLENHDDLSIFIKFKNFLNDKNLHKLNQSLQVYLTVSRSNIGNIVKTKKCHICFLKNPLLNFNCGHSVCYQCYPKINRCPFCRKIIK